MNKRWLAILAGVLAFFVVLGVGLLAGGTIAYLTLKARPVEAAFSLQAANPDAQNGILVAEVAAGGPAAQSGLVRGDILLSFNDQTLNTFQDLKAQLAQAKPGDVVSLSVLHGDETRNFSITLGDNNGVAYLGIVPCLTGGQDLRGFQPNFNGKTATGAGAQVTQVIADSPAAKVGLQAGDTILAVDGQEVNADNTLGDLIQRYQPNDTVNLSVQKSGAAQTSDIQVTLGENPDTPGKAFLGIYYANPGQQNGPMPYFQNPGNGDNGQTQPFNGQPFGQMLPSLPNGVSQAVVIGDVISGTPAAQAGLQVNDVITAVDGQAVTDAQALVDTIASHKPGDQVTLTVYRSGQADSLSITVTLGENPNQAGAAYLGVSISNVSSGLPQGHPPINPQSTPNNNDSTVPGWPGGGDA